MPRPTPGGHIAPTLADRGSMRLSALVGESLKARLLDGEYAFDETLSVEVLSKELRVSKQPVMQALRILEADGLVAIIPQVGCKVASYDLDEIKDFLRIHAAMEGAVAELAAVRRSEEQLADFRALVEQSRPRALRGDPSRDRIPKWRLLNREFHEAVHAMAGARMVSEVSRRMWDLRDFVVFQSAVLRDRELLDRTDTDHMNIYEAIRDQDAALARAESEHHVLSILKYLATDESGRRPRHRD